MNTEFLDIDKTKPLVLLLGNVDHEGITSPLKAGGEQYKKKVLASGVENWRSIVTYFDEFRIRGVIIKFNGQVYELLANSEYGFVGPELLKRIAAHRHIAFIYQDLLSGHIDPARQKTGSEHAQRDDYDREDLEWSHESHLRRPSAETLRTVNDVLRKHELNLIPYTTNAELTVMATQFLRDSLEQLLFRMYVPSGRLWANEVDRLLQLFRDFLLKTGRKGLRLEQIRTDSGILYEFHGDDSSAPLSLSDDFQDFSHLLDLCVSDPREAEALLRYKSVSDTDIVEILTRYGKEARRLQTDLKHERERKLLGIRQRLESELADVLPPNTNWKLIERLVDSAIPRAINIGAAYTIDQNSLRSVAGQEPGVTINLNPQIIHEVKGIVAQEIRGDANISEYDEKLLDLIQHHAGSRAVELASAVHELSDPGIPGPKRLISRQKLRAFIFGVGSRLGEVGMKVLQSYIEGRLQPK